MAVEKASHVIVLGNEKGGTGKSTTAMHLAIALMRMGRSVGLIDLDARQQSLARYVANREQWVRNAGIALPTPEVHVVEKGTHDSVMDIEADERSRFEGVTSDLRARCDFILIDSPGSDSHLSRLGHALADTLITPLNDSFVDFDLLARVDADSLDVISPSLYSEMVWDARKRRALDRRKPIDWVVMRNRLSNIDAINKRRLAALLDKLSARIGFRVAPGFGERVIYRELFLFGLTLLDLPEARSQVKMTMSHLAARQELRDLIAVLDLPGVETSTDALAAQPVA